MKKRLVLLFSILSIVISIHIVGSAFFSKVICASECNVFRSATLPQSLPIPDGTCICNNVIIDKIDCDYFPDPDYECTIVRCVYTSTITDPVHRF